MPDLNFQNPFPGFNRFRKMINAALPSFVRERADQMPCRIKMKKNPKLFGFLVNILIKINATWVFAFPELAGFFKDGFAGCGEMLQNLILTK